MTVPIHINNQTPSKLHYNGQEIDNVYFNGVRYFQRSNDIVYPDGIRAIRVTSNGRGILITFDGSRVQYGRFTQGQWSITDDGATKAASGATVRRGNQLQVDFSGSAVAEGSAMVVAYSPSGGNNRRIRLDGTPIAAFTHSWTDDRTAPRQTGWSDAQNRDLTIVFNEDIDSDHIPTGDELTAFFLERGDTNAEVPITEIFVSGREVTFRTNGFGDIRANGFYFEYLGYTTGQTGLDAAIPASRRLQDTAANYVGPFDFEFVP